MAAATPRAMPAVERTSATRPRRWAATLGMSIDQLVAWGVLYYAYAVLSTPIAEDLGVPTRIVAGAFSCTLLVSGLLARPVGRMLDRAGARPILLLGAVVGPAVFAAIAAARAELPLVLAFAALGIAHALSLYESAFRAVLDWFPGETHRSRALLVLHNVAGLASTGFPAVHRTPWGLFLMCSDGAGTSHPCSQRGTIPRTNLAFRRRTSPVGAPRAPNGASSGSGRRPPLTPNVWLPGFSGPKPSPTPGVQPPFPWLWNLSGNEGHYSR